MASNQPKEERSMYAELYMFDETGEEVPAIRCTLEPDGTASVMALTDNDMAKRTAASLRRDGVENRLFKYWRSGIPPQDKRYLSPKDPELGEDFIQALPRIFNSSMHGFRATIIKGIPPHQSAS